LRPTTAAPIGDTALDEFPLDGVGQPDVGRAPQGRRPVVWRARRSRATASED
jgi:hypothetical protein